jgi:NADH-quinone oxidoreductase subunit A
MTDGILETPADYVPIMIQAFIVLGFVITTMIVTHLLGPKRKTKQKLENFECGIEGMGNARSPFSVKYFLIAILFVLFDVDLHVPLGCEFQTPGDAGFP